MTTPAQLPSAESLTVEFKSDVKRLPDHELVDAVVCLANTDGGTIYLGVEDDGRPTGLHPKHLSLDGLPAMIANKTSPPVRVNVTPIDADGIPVARIEVPKARHIVATADGTIKRRRLDAQGNPECVPLLPQEIATRLSDLTVLDVSAQPVPGATMADLDPVERARLRQFIDRFHGDASLRDITDDELDGALGLVVREGAGRVPTLAGVLLIGKEASIRRLVPTHEVAFQVLDAEKVLLNEFSRAPLLRVFEWLDGLFTPRNPEHEIQVGLFRVPVPRVDRQAFREAIANALTHRDYARTGAVHVRFEADALIVSNPGGFVEGVTQDNLLTTEPRPRNPRLADALKRVGLVERTGRGVDLIYRSTIRYGRPLPSYGRSTTATVVLEIPASDADLNFLRLVLDAEEKRGNSLPVDSLIALSCVRAERRVSVEDVGRAIHKDRAAAKRTLEALLEAGLVEAHGQTRARSYTFSSGVYEQEGRRAEYTRQAGYDRIGQAQMVVDCARQHGEVKRADVVELCRVTEGQATRLLRRLVDEGRLCKRGSRRWTAYVIPEGPEETS